jgi:hypothetical protein
MKLNGITKKLRNNILKITREIKRNKNERRSKILDTTSSGVVQVKENSINLCQNKRNKKQE